MPLGRPCSYHSDLLAKLLEGISRSCSLTQAAAYAGVPPRTFMDWVKRGDEDWHAGKDTELAELSREVQRERAKKSMELEAQGLATDLSMPKWLLSKCFRGDYGDQLEVIDELTNCLNKLKQDLENVKNNKFKPLIKDAENGQEELDQSGN
jgi:hypothetical protein